MCVLGRLPGPVAEPTGIDYHPRMTTTRRTVLMAGAGVLAAAARGGASGQATARGTSSAAPREIRVWPGAAPGGATVTVKPTVLERSTSPAIHDRAWTGIVDPTLAIYTPSDPDGSAVLIMPGGAYLRVVIDKEGDDTARALNAHGITAAVLTYRLPGDGWDAGRDAPLQDAQRALRLLRSGAAGKLDPARIGVLGYSAGGDLAAAAAIRHDATTYAPLDDADKLAAKPAFAGLMYAAIDMPLRAPGGGSAAPARSLVQQISPATPPCFLMHAADDPSVPVQRSLEVFTALKAAKVPAELHVFEEGGHGFGIRLAEGKPVHAWPDLFVAWGSRHGFFGNPRG
jgi:acetyl esterase/lipase